MKSKCLCPDQDVHQSFPCTSQHFVALRACLMAKFSPLPLKYSTLAVAVSVANTSLQQLNGCFWISFTALHGLNCLRHPNKPSVWDAVTHAQKPARGRDGAKDLQMLELCTGRTNLAFEWLQAFCPNFAALRRHPLAQQPEPFFFALSSAASDRQHLG